MNFNNDLIDTDEAAQILDVQPKSVRNWVRKGMLIPAPVLPTVHNGYRFRREDVVQLAEVMRRPTPYAHVVAIAQQASVNVQRLETVVRRLLRLLDADVPFPDLSPEGVRATCLQAEEALKALDYSLEEATTWSQIFLGLGPEFLEVAERHVVEEPWILFTDLARKLVLYFADHFKAHTLEETAALQYLAMSARNLRRSCFLYIHRSIGREASTYLFPETLNDIHHELSHLAITMYQSRPDDV
jgi:DNA-binding transcriptional MerR regulator